MWSEAIQTIRENIKKGQASIVESNRENTSIRLLEALDNTGVMVDCSQKGDEFLMSYVAKKIFAQFIPVDQFAAFKDFFMKGYNLNPSLYNRNLIQQANTIDDFRDAINKYNSRYSEYRWNLLTVILRILPFLNKKEIVLPLLIEQTSDITQNEVDELGVIEYNQGRLESYIPEIQLPIVIILSPWEKENIKNSPLYRSRVYRNIVELHDEE